MSDIAMRKRKQFRISDEDYEAIMKIARTPAPLMYLSGGTPMFRSKQEQANDVWQAMAKRLGFVWDTAHPADTGDPKDFTAEVEEKSSE